MKQNPIPLLSIVIFLVFMQSCSLSNPYEDVENQNNSIGTSSSNGSRKSHNMGLNCMICHRPGGGEAPTWQIAGTVYDEALVIPYPNATVNLYTGPNRSGNLKYTLAVDARGNFYTSGKIDFTSGLYPSVSGNNTTYSMSTPITNGACNSCHDGVSRSRIWTN